MVTRNLQPKNLKKSIVEMAVAAVESNANPLDVDMSGVGTDPTDLGLDDGTLSTVCQHRQFVCAGCGRPLR